MAKKTISQSKTQYIKKGQKLSNGKIAQKGYVARKGNDLKKVTANVRLTATGDSANSKRLAGKKIGDVVKAQPSRGGGKGGGKGGGDASGPTPPAPPTDAQKKAARIAKTTVKARNADTQRRKSGTAKTTTTLAKPKAPKSKYAGSEGPKGSDRQRVIAGARIDGVKVSKRSGSGSNASSWGKGGGSSLSLPSFLKPGKNAPKMPKYTSSSNYKWKG